jgi:hypothetical protein
MTEQVKNSPVVTAETRFLAAETNEKTYLFPYIGLRLAELSEIAGRKNRWLFELHFDLGIVRIRGNNLRTLIEEFQHERVFSIRKGISMDPNLPEIDSVEVDLVDGVSSAAATEGTQEE